MPKYLSVSYGPDTPAKQEKFDYLTKVLCRASSGMLLKNQWMWNKFFYIDMNSGPGRVNGDLGSPLIFLLNARKNHLQHRTFFIEKDSRSVEMLNRNIEGFESSATVLHGDNQAKILECFDEIRGVCQGRKPVGLIYSDPNGEIDELPFDTLAHASGMKVCERMDILIHISATIIKRVRRSNYCSFKRNLCDLLGGINKKFWRVWIPNGAFQWSFFYGTNWSRSPVFKSKGFIDLNTDEGAGIMSRLNLTDDELENIT